MQFMLIGWLSNAFDIQIGLLDIVGFENESRTWLILYYHLNYVDLDGLGAVVPNSLIWQYRLSVEDTWDLLVTIVHPGIPP